MLSVNFVLTYIIADVILMLKNSKADAFVFRVLMLSFSQKISTKSKELRRDIFILEETPCHDSGWFWVGLRLEPMFTFSIVNVHQAEGKIHNLYLKCWYVTLEKLISQAVQ